MNNDELVPGIHDIGEGLHDAADERVEIDMSEAKVFTFLPAEDVPVSLRGTASQPWGGDSRVRPAQGLLEISRELDRLRRYNPHVRYVELLAIQQGFSEAEKYMVMAYYALKQNDELADAILKHFSSRPLTAPFPTTKESNNHGNT